ncbi:MAG: LPS export ABC transporter ATP-binding protein [Gammaproteobacteria bacterium]|nr:LPS export ABC transporter ATP-binding protein [Gammaproteobacteria bacterium]
MSELIVSNLAKAYRSRKVVKNVSLTVRSGEAVGLLGPNGAGKTTSFHMIVGLIRPDAGKIEIDGKDLSKATIDQRARIGLGYLPQEASVFRRLTVYENIAAVLEVMPGMTSEQRERRIEELLHRFHIGHLHDTLGMALSGGERRRLEIARALAIEPRFILLDEPFAGVDPISVVDIQRIIEHLRTLDIGVLITDHNVRETLGVCDRAYIVSDGEIIAEGTATDILANEKVRDVYLGERFTM